MTTFQTPLDHLLDSCSTVRPLSEAEIDRLRAHGRRDDSFDALAERAMRIRLLDLAGCLPGDADARRGVRRAEASALVELALRRAATPLQLDLRKRVFAGACEFRDDNLEVILAASMAADATLIARRPAPSRGSVLGRGLD